VVFLAGATISSIPKWFLVGATIFLFMGALLQAGLELRRYKRVAASLQLALTRGLQIWSSKQYKAIAADFSKMMRPTDTREYLDAAKRIAGRGAVLGFWPWVGPFVLLSMLREAGKVWRSEPILKFVAAGESGDKLPELSAGDAVVEVQAAAVRELIEASLKFTGWSLVVVGAAAAFVSAILDLVLA